MTLRHFIEALLLQLAGRNGELELIQIHAAPGLLAEGLELLASSAESSTPRKILIHRPDELLLNPELRNFFEAHPRERLVFLGDLVFREEFWRRRRPCSPVIPYPHLDLSLPRAVDGGCVVGAFTTWGELRKLEHYQALVEELSCRDTAGKLRFVIGGTLNGKPLPDLGEKIRRSPHRFVPHFNVQLYHLNGRKRFGESSGSLHGGVTISVIFEANGAERIEGITVVKVAADDELRRIDFARAAEAILAIVEQGVDRVLEENLRRARKNSIEKFVEEIRSPFVDAPLT